MGLEILPSVGALGSGILYAILGFLFVLTVVVFIHELGHFLVARWYGVKVLVFSIGFGPELFGFNDRYGTRWKLSAIPLGGYVKFFGDENAASVPDQAAAAAMTEAERKVSFVHQKVGPRAAIVVAGPLANFILAIVIFAVAAMVYGRQSTLPRVDTVQPNSAAAAAGFQPGDIVQLINGRAIRSFSDMQRIVSFSAGEPLTIVVERAGKPVTLKATPALQDVKDNFGNTHRMGVLGITRSLAADEVRFERVGFLTAVGIGFTETWALVEQTMTYIWRIFAGRASADQLGGPIMIAQMSGQVASVSFSLLVQFVAMISVSIGLLNLFPVPLLDGGHLLFYSIEAARGRPLSERAQEYGFRLGMALVLMLMVFATYNDIGRLASLWPRS
ncbi:MAG: RIP metalloprotease RseP [Xanthobacteraceae bacterium]|nr:RIP metalloprotease RseP [Xanthobacteraceae bacterium]